MWLAVLSILKKKKAYAYALPGEIERRFGFAPSKLMTYFVLYKLESEGLVFSSFEGRRKYYQITQKGKQALLEAKSLLASLSRKL
ncbi:MAG: PadR family transcriptional regulator [Candidatus Micrarchaeota archaeon]|nr:PadR family transcriptional regulator [Candidatus Micrarchaeota archaeon]